MTTTKYALVQSLRDAETGSRGTRGNSFYPLQFHILHLNVFVPLCVCNAKSLVYAKT